MDKIVNAIHLLTQAILKVSISLPQAFGSYFISSDAYTVCTTAGTYYKIVGTTAANLLEKFTHSDNKLVYTGAETRRFRIIAVSTVYGTTGPYDINMAVGLNGTAISNSGMQYEHATGASDRHLSTSWDIELSTGDYIEMFFSASLNAKNVRAKKMIVSIC